MSKPETFEQWYDELLVIVERCWPESKCFEEMKNNRAGFNEAYRGYYEDGYTPAEAWYEELSYGL